MQPKGVRIHKVSDLKPSALDLVINVGDDKKVSECTPPYVMIQSCWARTGKGFDYKPPALLWRHTLLFRILLCLVFVSTLGTNYFWSTAHLKNVGAEHIQGMQSIIHPFISQIAVFHSVCHIHKTKSSQT